MDKQEMQNLMNNLAIDIRRDEWDDKDDIAQTELLLARKKRSFEAKEKAHAKHYKKMLAMGFPPPQEDVIQEACKSCP